MRICGASAVSPYWRPRFVPLNPGRPRYRNKAQFPLVQTPDGVRAGFYASRSHRVIPCEDCLLQPEIFSEIVQFLEKFIDRFHIPVYEEATGKGLVRHLYLRRGEVSGEVMLCLVINGSELPHCGQFVNAVTARFPEISSIILNINREKTNVVLGRKKPPALWERSHLRHPLRG